MPTMLDQFAMAALTGLLANTGDAERGNAITNSTPEHVAELAYTYAKAMRNQSRQEQPR